MVLSFSDATSIEVGPAFLDLTRGRGQTGTDFSLQLVLPPSPLPCLPGGVSQSVDLGQSNNPNTTPTKDYKNVQVVVCLCGVQRGYAEEGERGSTPTG